MGEFPFSGDEPREEKNTNMPVGGRVAGKVGIYSSHYNGNMDVDIVLLGIYDSIATLAPKQFLMLVAAKFITYSVDSRVSKLQKLLRYDCGMVGNQWRNSVITNRREDFSSMHFFRAAICHNK